MWVTRTKETEKKLVRGVGREKNKCKLVLERFQNK